MNVIRRALTQVFNPKLPERLAVLGSLGMADLKIVSMGLRYFYTRLRRIPIIFMILGNKVLLNFTIESFV